MQPRQTQRQRLFLPSHWRCEGRKLPFMRCYISKVNEKVSSHIHQSSSSSFLFLAHLWTWAGCHRVKSMMSGDSLVRSAGLMRYRGSSCHGAACAAAGLSGQKTVTVDAPGLLHVDACAVIQQLIIPHPTYYRCLLLPRAVRRCSCALCSQHPACTSCTAVLHRPSASLSLFVFPAHNLSFSLSITHTP